MIAMALGLAIIAAVGYVYLSGTQGYRVQDAQSRMQEDARFVIDTLSRDIRMAGYFGCARGDLAYATSTGSHVEVKAMQPVMTLDLSWWMLSGNDNSARDRFVNPAFNLRGFSGSTALAAQALPASVVSIGTTSGRRPGTDVLMIIRSSEDGQNLIPTDESGAANPTVMDQAKFTLPATIPGVSSGEAVTAVVSDCRVAKIIKPTWTINASTKAVAVSIDNGVNAHATLGAGEAGDLGGKFKEDAVVSVFSPSLYFVSQPSSANLRPTLRRLSIGSTPVNYGGWANNGGTIVATGVETFTTSYIVTTQRGTSTATSTEFTLADMEANPDQAVWNDVTAVRIRFTMVSQNENVAIQSADNLLRQNYDFTVGIRSRQYSGTDAR